MVRQVNLYEAKTNLSRLVEEAAKGEDVVIAKNGKAMARLTSADVAEKPKERVGGQWGRFLTPEERQDVSSPDWWRRWKEADAEILRDFEQSLNEDPARFEWQNTSSTRTPSSRSKATPSRSARKRTKRSKARRTKSS